MFQVHVQSCLSVVSTSTTDCLQTLVCEMTCYVSSGTLNPTITNNNNNANNSESI